MLRQGFLGDNSGDDDGSEREDTNRRLLQDAREVSLRESSTRGGGEPGRRRSSDGMGNSFRDRRVRSDDAPSDSADRARRRRDGERRSRGHSQHQAARNAARVRDGIQRANSSRQVEHQSSLRSILSSSDLGIASQEEIVRQIIEEGLLDDIDFDNLDQAQEEELSDRLAEIWRQRHQQRADSQRRNSDRAERPRTTDHRRSRSQTVQAASTSDVGHADSRPTSNFLDPRNALDMPNRHQRRSSGQGTPRRRTSPTPIVTPSALEEPVRTTARSSTDINEHRTRVSPSGRLDTREAPGRHLESDSRVPEAWAGALTRDRSPQHSSISSPRTRPSSASTNPSDTAGTVISGLTTSPSLTVTPSPRRRREEVATDQRGASTHNLDTNASPLTWYVEPSIACDRCQRKNIQYEVHKKCTKCNNGNYHLCLRCYRSGKGCLHWSGFGYAAHTPLEQHAASGGSQSPSEPPHILRSRRYRRPQEGRHRTTSEGRIQVTEKPDERLEEGLFCDGCQALANDYFWQCSHCNKGDWGFCSRCVNQARCCTHPLLPIRRAGASQVATATPATSEALPAPIVYIDANPYHVLSISTNCDICASPILPSSTRYHCPKCSDGDYDVCTNCYLKLVATGKIRKENGHNGWRRCLKGHRMIVVRFEDHEEGQRRVVIRDLVGGHTIIDDHVPHPRDNQMGGRSAIATTTGRPGTRKAASPQMGSGDWSWRDGQVRRKKASRVRMYGWNNPSATHNTHHVSTPPSPLDVAAAVASTALTRSFDDNPVSPLTSNKHTNISHQHTTATAIAGGTTPSRRFPPDGGVGLILVAQWSYWPEEADHDELAFPSGAEIMEAESINEDWNWGYYAGSTGLIPAAYCQVMREVT